MSQSDDVTSDAVDHRFADLTASDPSEVNGAQRIRDIHNARDHVREVQRTITELRIRGRVDENAMLTAFRNALENYILEVEWLIRNPKAASDEERTRADNTRDELEQYYWESVRLGSMKLPNGERIEFEGLRSIVDAPNPIVVTTVEESSQPGMAASTEEVEYHVQVEETILKRAYRQVNAFLAEVDLEVTLEEEGLPTWSFNYVGEDMVEEEGPGEANGDHDSGGEGSE
jgi:hypothetical protein